MLILEQGKIGIRRTDKVICRGRALRKKVHLSLIPAEEREADKRSSIIFFYLEFGGLLRRVSCAAYNRRRGQGLAQQPFKTGFVKTREIY